jgi:hypothetical protein
MVRIQTAQRYAALLLAAVALIGGAGQAVADETPAPQQRTVGLGTAGPEGLDGRTSFVFAIKPGESVKDRVAVLNYTTDPLPVRIYSADGFTTEAGALDIAAESVKRSDVGRWASLEPRTVTIPARKKLSDPPAVRLVPFTVKVPADATTGDHIGAVVVSLPNPKSAKGNLVVDQRLAMPITVRVVGEVNPQAEVEVLRAEQTGRWAALVGGTSRVTYRVTNSGNTVWSGVPTVTVSGPFGLLSRSVVEAPVERLLPGSSVERTVAVSGVASLVVLEAEAVVVPAAEVADPFDAATGSAYFWAVPWLWAVIIAAIWVGRWLWKRRSKRGGPIDDHDDVELLEKEEVPA